MKSHPYSWPESGVTLFVRPCLTPPLATGVCSPFLLPPPQSPPGNTSVTGLSLEMQNPGSAPLTESEAALHKICRRFLSTLKAGKHGSDHPECTKRNNVFFFTLHFNNIYSSRKKMGNMESPEIDTYMSRLSGVSMNVPPLF